MAYLEWAGCLWRAVFQRDYPILMALTLLGATMLVVANLAIDILYSVVDPRIRLRS